jgi:SAM-dependent methyltransferase
MARFDAKAYWESRLGERFDLRGVGDIGLSTAYNGYLYRMRALAFRRAVRRLGLRPGDLDVLDVGSGTGFYVDQWLRLGVAGLTGSDLTETAVSQLSLTRPLAQFVRCDIGGPLPEALADRQFDVVSAFDMLFHIVNDDSYAAAIANFARLVRPGGHLIFSDNLGDRAIMHGPHQKSRSEAEATALLRTQGFRPVGTLPMFVLMNDPVRSNSRWLKRIFGRVQGYAARGEREGQAIGRVMLPMDALLTAILARGPSTEIYLWRRN